MTKEFWQSVRANTAGDAILTGYVGEFKDMPVYKNIISLMGSGDRALDFGCGVGRNVKSLSESFRQVVGYDLPNMIDLVPIENKSGDREQITYTTDWELLRRERFDAVLASLVFQHIEDNELNNYLYAISEMTNRLVLHSRTWIDHTETKVLPMVEKYFIIDQIEYQKDPNNDSDDHFVAVLSARR